MIRTISFSLSMLLLMATTATAQSSNPLATALAFAHQHATAKAVTPSNDQRLKATLLAAVNKQPPVLVYAEVSELFDQARFAALAADNKLSLSQLEDLMAASIPASRNELFPAVRTHADLLATQFDQLAERHQQAANELAAWIAKSYDSQNPLAVNVICTGNSRRSMLGSTLGNVAAAYYGLPKLTFHSGGTAPSAFNARTIATLQAIGIQIEASGQEAPRGKADDPNPIYQVRWGEQLTAAEFSKLYSHRDNPQKNFAAILVCDEADAACPTVAGAAIRIPAPFFDPKAFDGAPFEAAKYAERRDDIGRMMLCAVMQATNELRRGKQAK